MVLKSKTSTGFLLDLNREEARTILGVMNEFLLGQNALEDEEWDELMSHSKEDAMAIMDQIANLLDQ